jgi:hypothetical protein
MLLFTPNEIVTILPRYAKTPTGKKRNKFMEGDEEEGKKEKKKSGKKKEKK